MRSHRLSSPRSARIRIGLALAALLLVVGGSVGPAPAAHATEFDPVPKITYLAQCFGSQGLHVSFVLSNEGQGVASFHLVETVDGVATVTDDFSVLNTPATPDYFVAEDIAPTFTVTSTDGPGASFSYAFGPVDCVEATTTTTEVTTTTTEVTTTTTEASTTTVPDDPTTTEPGPTSTTAGPAVVSQGTTPPAAPFVSDGTLARTGSNDAALAAVAMTLLALGAIALTARRRLLR